jgi:uncharacterized protein YdiU (UPF0061 family)
MLSSAASAQALAAADPDFHAWYQRLLARRAREARADGMAEDLLRRHNPAFIPRNHKVEDALEAAATALDMTAFERLLDVVRTPYDHTRDRPEFSTTPEGAPPYRTFCGT